MKILNILLAESAMLAFRDLTDLQTTVLRRVVLGKSTYQTASPREQAVMDELVDFGLLSDLSFEATPRGVKVAELAAKHGSTEGKEIQRRSAALGATPFEKDRRYSTVGDASDVVDPNEVPDITGQARQIDRGAIVR